MTREPLPAVDWSIFRPGHSPIELSLSSPWTDTADGAVKLGRTHPATGTEVDAHETDDRNATAEEGRKQEKTRGVAGADAAKPPAQSATRQCDTPRPGRPAIPGQGDARRDRPVAAGKPELERRAWPRLHVPPHAAPPEPAARRGEQSATVPSSSSTHLGSLALPPPDPEAAARRSHVVVARRPGRRRDPSDGGSDPVPRRCPVSVRTGPAWFSCRDLVVLAGTRLPDLRLREGNRGAGPHADAAAAGRQAGSRATTTRLVSARKRYDRQGKPGL